MKHTPLILALVITSFGCSTSDPVREFSRPDAGDDAGETVSDTALNNIDEDTEVSADMIAADTDPSICRPNNDGTITRAEVPIEVGLSAKFRIATDVTFDTAGDNGVWDLNQDFTDDTDTLVTLTSPSGQWWETSYPTATYSTPLTNDSDLLGIFEVTEDALLLIAVVSPEDSVFATELEYDPKVPVLQFPIEAGSRWTVDTSATGRFNGGFATWNESYVFEADATGQLNTPYADFDAIRVRSVLDRQVGILNTTIRSFAFVTECFGTVATIRSTDDETETNFTDVSELRRLTR